MSSGEIWGTLGCETFELTRCDGGYLEQAILLMKRSGWKTQRSLCCNYMLVAKMELPRWSVLLVAKGLKWFFCFPWRSLVPFFFQWTKSNGVYSTENAESWQNGGTLFLFLGRFLRPLGIISEYSRLSLKIKMFGICRCSTINRFVLLKRFAEFVLRIIIKRRFLRHFTQWLA